MRRRQQKKGQPDEFSDAIPLRGRDLDQAEYRQIVADEKQSTGRARLKESADILRAAMRAIEEPEVAALAEEGDCHRREVIDGLTRRWAGEGMLRSGLSPEAAADRLWLLTTVEGYLNAVDRLGWTPEAYEEWLARLAEAEILRPDE